MHVDVQLCSSEWQAADGYAAQAGAGADARGEGVPYCCKNKRCLGEVAVTSNPGQHHVCKSDLHVPCRITGLAPSVSAVGGTSGGPNSKPSVAPAVCIPLTATSQDISEEGLDPVLPALQTLETGVHESCSPCFGRRAGDDDAAAGGRPAQE